MCNSGAGPREQQIKKNWDAKYPNQPFPISPTNKQEPGKTSLTTGSPVEKSLRLATDLGVITKKKKPPSTGSKVGSTLLTGNSDYS